MSRVLVVSFSDLARDPRVDRQIAALGSEHEVVAAGLGRPGRDVEFVDLSGPPRGVPGRALGLARLLLRRHRSVYWRHPDIRRAAARLAGVRCDAVVANDAQALPLALALDGSPPVVFDAHEYAVAEQAEKRWWRLVMAPYVRWMVDGHVPRAAAMMTVAPAIAEAYERDTGVRPAVVMNAPARADLEPSPVGRPVRLLHHGVAQAARRLELMIEVAERLDERFTLDLVLAEGDRGYRERLIQRAAGNPRVAFPPPRAMSELVRAANDYDIGVYLLPPGSFNQRYALPNKIFEFIQARLAVAVGPSPEMARVVREHGVGVVADDFEPASLAAAINALSDAEIAAAKERSHAAAQVLCAEANADTVRALVRRALGEA